MNEFCRKFYLKARGLICPSLKYSQSIYEDVISSHVRRDIDWLDLGCGHTLLPGWRSKEEAKLVKTCKKIVGIDYDYDSLKKNKSIRLKTRGDAFALPFLDNSFSLVTANMVVEHLENPAIQFREIYRVLKPGGLFIFHTPNFYGYGPLIARLVPEKFKKDLLYLLEKRDENDIFPVFYKINTVRDIKKVSALSGFNMLDLKMIVSSAMFTNIPPLVIFELIWIRLLMTKRMKPLRTNIIAVLEKK